MWHVLDGLSHRLRCHSALAWRSQNILKRRVIAVEYLENILWSSHGVLKAYIHSHCP